MTKFHTPNDIASALQAKVDKVYSLIATGQLSAVNISERRGGRPRWRISDEDLQQFLRSRQSVKPTPPTRRRKRQTTVKQYF